MWWELHEGRWDDATDTADGLIADLRDSPAPRAEAHLVLAVVRARRGDPGAASALAEAAKVPNAEATWSTRLANVAAEIEWLAGPLVSHRAGDRRRLSRDGPANRRSGRAPSSPSGAIEPDSAVDRRLAAARADRARDRQAVTARRRAPGTPLGCPYEAAVALSLADDPADIADGHERLRALERAARGDGGRAAGCASAASAASPAARAGRRARTLRTSRRASSTCSPCSPTA